MAQAANGERAPPTGGGASPARRCLRGAPVVTGSDPGWGPDSDPDPRPGLDPGPAPHPVPIPSPGPCLLRWPRTAPSPGTHPMSWMQQVRRRQPQRALRAWGGSGRADRVLSGSRLFQVIFIRKLFEIQDTRPIKCHFRTYHREVKANFSHKVCFLSKQEVILPQTWQHEPKRQFCPKSEFMLYHAHYPGSGLCFGDLVAGAPIERKDWKALFMYIFLWTVSDAVNP